MSDYKDQSELAKALPDLDQPKMYFNVDSGMAWVGIPCKKLSIWHTLLALDAFKMPLYNFSLSLGLAASARQKIIEAGKKLGLY